MSSFLIKEAKANVVEVSVLLNWHEHGQRKKEGKCRTLKLQSSGKKKARLRTIYNYLIGTLQLMLH